VIENIRNICRENQQLLWLATDQPNWQDPDWSADFKYQFNSRGFRGPEWPDDLSDAVWTFGDSEMLGVGLPYHASIPGQLSALFEKTAVNVSIMRASNAWIARQVNWLLNDSLSVSRILIQWSFTTRTELDLGQAKSIELLELYKSIKQFHWPKVKTAKDLHQVNPMVMENLDQDPYGRKIHRMRGAQENAQIHCRPELLFNMGGARSTVKLIADVQKNAPPDCKIVHSFVPNFGTEQEKQFVYDELDQLGVDYIPEYSQIDYARDGQHSGIETVKQFTSKVYDRLL